MIVLSVNVAGPCDLAWAGRLVRTSLLKTPVTGPVRFRGVNLEGDDQSDRTVHGGARKSVYVYPGEHYPSWRSELGRPELPYGSFGENLTTEGWLECDARVGDRVRIGTAEFEVTQPRRPCYKLEAAFQRGDMVRRFHASGRSGFYLGGRKEGELREGDSIRLLSSEPDAPSIAEIVKAEMAEE